MCWESSQPQSRPAGSGSPLPAHSPTDSAPKAQAGCARGHESASPTVQGGSHFRDFREGLWDAPGGPGGRGESDCCRSRAEGRSGGARPLAANLQHQLLQEAVTMVQSPQHLPPGQCGGGGGEKQQDHPNAQETEIGESRRGEAPPTGHQSGRRRPSTARPGRQGLLDLRCHRYELIFHTAGKRVLGRTQAKPPLCSSRPHRALGVRAARGGPSRLPKAETVSVQLPYDKLLPQTISEKT